MVSSCSRAMSFSTSAQLLVGLAHLLRRARIGQVVILLSRFLVVQLMYRLFTEELGLRILDFLQVLVSVRRALSAFSGRGPNPPSAQPTSDGSSPARHLRLHHGAVHRHAHFMDNRRHAGHLECARAPVDGIYRKCASDEAGYGPAHMPPSLFIKAPSPGRCLQ